jgi:ABC-2 type transport system ATP-binding protein
MEATIEVTGLRKRFGPALALDGMTFTVAPGQVTGFVGPNGAGKSTTMRIILGLDAADAGMATVGGRPYAGLRHPLSQVGSLLDAGALQPSRSARNHLLWLAHSQGLGARRADEVIEQAGLRSAARRKAGGYSLGMRQRLGIAAALLGPRDLLVLDEPTNGLDPQGTREVRSLVRSLAAEGRTVFVSSHLLAEVEQICTHVGVMSAGRLVAQGTLDDLSSAGPAHVRVRTPDAGAAVGVLSGLRLAGADVNGEDVRAVLPNGNGGPAPEDVVAALVAAGVRVRGFAVEQESLEERFVALTGEGFEVVR